jgi:ribose/xylose/arabinose/galactoside ABC-type transport system permease subunit
MNSLKNYFVRFKSSPAFTGFVLFVFALVLNLIIRGPGTFLGASSMGTLFAKNAPIILVTLAQAVLLITGSLDISIGIQLALVNVVVIMLPQELGMPIPLAWLFGILVALAISVVGGFLVAILRVPSILATFALTFIVKGINVLIMNVPQGSVPKAYYSSYDKVLFGFLPVAALIIAGVLLIWMFVKRTKFGKHIYAVGANPRNAFAAGINPSTTIMKAFLFKGLITGIAGISLTLMIAAGNPLQVESYGLKSLAACIIGGLGFGGWGTMASAVYGAGFLVLIQNAVYYFFNFLQNTLPGFQITSYWQNFISDAIVLLGLLMTTVTARAQREALRQGTSKQLKRGKQFGKQ